MALISFWITAQLNLKQTNKQKKKQFQTTESVIFPGPREAVMIEKYKT